MRDEEDAGKGPERRQDEGSEDAGFGPPTLLAFPYFGAWSEQTPAASQGGGTPKSL